MFVALAAMLLCLLLALCWPVWWEYQQKGPAYQIKVNDQQLSNHFGTLQTPVHKALNIRFNSPGGNNILSCCLDYGDGTVDTVRLSRGTSLSHAYAEAGTYVMSLLIWEKRGNSIPQKRLLAQVEVDCPDKLTHSFDASISLMEEGYEVNFESQTSGAPENELTYLWNFGDGSISTERSPTHIYPKQGTYHVGLSISRFLSSSYSCGDTAYQAARMRLGTTSEFAPLPAFAALPPARKNIVRMSGWFVGLMGVILALLGMGAYLAARWFYQNKGKRKSRWQEVKGPAFLQFPQARPRLLSEQKLFALSQGLQQALDATSGQKYLVLIEKQSRHDLFAQVMEQLWLAIRKAGVPLEYYFFQDDPRHCVEPENGHAVSFSSLAERHLEAPLVLCTDGGCLIDSYLKGLAEWISEELEPWSGRKFIFTPIPMEDWEEIESYLTREFVLCPANQPLVLPSCIQSGQYNPATPSRSHLISWKSGISYSSAALQRYLGEDLFRWLQMTALWPRLDSQWVMHLATLFKAEDGNYTYESLIRLSRLLWMREGGLPPDLAYRWLASLKGDDERNARELLLHLLEKSEAPEGSVAASEKERYIALQRFFLEPENASYARQAYMYAKGRIWGKNQQRLLQRKQKSLQGKSLTDYLQLRFGRMRALLGGGLTGLIVALLGIGGLHYSWQLQGHQGDTEISTTAWQSAIWRTEIWAGEEARLASKEEVPQEETPRETVPEAAPAAVPDDTAEVATPPIVQGSPCAEKESPLLLLKDGGIQGLLLADKSVLPDFNRLKAYARGNGVELDVQQSFPTYGGEGAFGEMLKIGRAVGCTLRYRKGLDWMSCDEACLMDEAHRPRPIRKFLEDLSGDRYWRWELEPQKAALRIWLARPLAAGVAKARAYEFADFYEKCPEAVE